MINTLIMLHIIRHLVLQKTSSTPSLTLFFHSLNHCVHINRAIMKKVHIKSWQIKPCPKLALDERNRTENILEWVP